MNQDFRPASRTTGSTKHKTNHDIETLRAVAILFVLFHHFGFLVVGQDAFRIYQQHFGLWSGVDLFFAISGFIIAKSYYEQFARAGLKNLAIVAGAFWVRRIFRLWPSAWLWLAVMVAQFTWIGLASFWNNVANAVAAVLEVANFHWWRCLGGHGVCGVIGNYWSLSLEEQFYMLFPFLFLLPRRAHAWILVAVAAVQIPIRRLPWAPDLGWFIRTDAIALGVCVYLLSRSALYQRIRPVFLDHKGAALAVAGGLLVLLAVSAQPQAFPDRAIVPFATGLVAILCALLVLIASYDRDWLFNIAVVRPVLLWIGARSYALYLLQASAYQAVQSLATKPLAARLLPGAFLSIATAIATFALMGVLAELNFLIIETPLRRKGAALAARLARPHDRTTELAS